MLSGLTHFFGGADVPVGESDTVVVFYIRPAIDEPRWRALAEAAKAAGAYHGHINPPTFVAKDETAGATSRGECRSNWEGREP